MMIIKILAICTIFLLNACSIVGDECEDVVAVAEQNQQCLTLQKRIHNNKQQPIALKELERRYEADCVDHRYYRDKQKSTICENNKKNNN